MERAKAEAVVSQIVPAAAMPLRVAARWCIGGVLWGTATVLSAAIVRASLDAAAWRELAATFALLSGACGVIGVYSAVVRARFLNALFDVVARPQTVLEIQGGIDTRLSVVDAIVSPPVTAQSSSGMSIDLLVETTRDGRRTISVMRLTERAAFAFDLSPRLERTLRAAARRALDVPAIHVRPVDVWFGVLRPGRGLHLSRSAEIEWQGRAWRAFFNAEYGMDRRREACCLIPVSGYRQSCEQVAGPGARS